MKKQAVRILSYLAPQMMSNLAYRTLTNPQVRKLRPNELVTLDRAEKEKIRFAEFDIQTYKWGNSQHEKILLIHGWEGQAGNFVDLIEALLENQYYVIAFDGPSHGFSSKGPTSLFEFAKLTGEMLRRCECKKLVSHSFGGVATTYALSNNQNLKIEKYVLLTTPDKFSQRIDDVAQFVGVTDHVKNLLIQRLETELKIDVQKFSVSNFVRDVNVKKSLIIHDKNDRVIPVSQAQNVFENWKNCQFIEVEGTGHFRILRSDTVIHEVLSFMD